MRIRNSICPWLLRGCFFFIMISFLLSYSRISFWRGQVKVIIFTYLLDGKFHADGGVNWAHTKSISTALSKMSRNDLLGNVSPFSRLTKTQLWRPLHYEKTFIPHEISPCINIVPAFWPPIVWNAFLGWCKSVMAFKIILRKALWWFTFKKPFLTPEREVFEVSPLINPLKIFMIFGLK